MKKVCLFLCSLLVVVGAYGQANALIFTLNDYAVNLNTTDPGLVVDYDKILPEPQNFNLSLGDSVTVDLFKIWTTESAINTDDLAPKPISVDFNFTSPISSFGGSIDGNTQGVLGGLFGSYQAGRVGWAGPIAMSFGSGGSLIAELSNEIFNKGYLWGTGHKGAKVGLTLTYQTAPVPEPSTLLLLGVGLLGLVGVGRKFRKE